MSMKAFSIGMKILLAVIILPVSSVEGYQIVKDFGAVGDGKADDTGALQRAVDSGGGDVFIPKGVYKLTKTVVIDLDRLGFTSITGAGNATILMAGAGPAFRFVGTHEGTAGPKTVKENVWLKQRKPSVRGIEIVGAHPAACGIEAAGTMKLTVSGVLVRKTLHGVHLVKRNRNVIISDCHIYENIGIGIYLDDVDLHQINVANSHVSYNEQGGIVVRGGNVRNLQIGNCDIEGNMGKDTPPTANVFIDPNGGTIGEIAITGCTIQHAHEAPDSANIRILGPGNVRPYANQEVRDGNITITGNVLSDVQVNVHIVKGRGITIVGNTFWKGYEANLVVEGCSQVVVGSNVFDRNPRYHYGDGATAKLGVIFKDCSDCILSGLQINEVKQHRGGLVLEDCQRINISGCNLLNCAGSGFYLDKIEDCIITGCSVQSLGGKVKDLVAVTLTDGKGNMIGNNLFTGQMIVKEGSAKLQNNLIRAK
jgi:parallel beta-helix repeat protein